MDSTRLLREQLLERIMPHTTLNCYPAQRGEFLNAKPSVTGCFHSPKGHLRFVMDGRTVDMADTAFNSFRKGPGPRDISAEDRSRQAEFGIIRDAQRLIIPVNSDHCDDGAERLFGIDAHCRSDAIQYRRLQSSFPRVSPRWQVGRPLLLRPGPNLRRDERDVRPRSIPERSAKVRGLPWEAKRPYPITSSRTRPQPWSPQRSARWTCKSVPDSGMLRTQLR
jgi:hypothetical protein